MTWEEVLKKSLKEEYLDYERLFSSSQYGSKVLDKIRNDYYNYLMESGLEVPSDEITGDADIDAIEAEYHTEEYYEFALPRMKKEEEKVQESR